MIHTNRTPGNRALSNLSVSMVKPERSRLSASDTCMLGPRATFLRRIRMRHSALGSRRQT